MLNRLAKLLLTSTAIAPVLLTYAWVAYRACAYQQAMVLILTCAALVAVCLGMLSYSKKHLERIPFSTITAEAADRENIGFLLLYLLPLFTSSFSALNWQVWIPAIAILPPWSVQATATTSTRSSASWVAFLQGRNERGRDIRSHHKKASAQCHHDDRSRSAHGVYRARFRRK